MVKKKRDEKKKVRILALSSKLGLGLGGLCIASGRATRTLNPKTLKPNWLSCFGLTMNFLLKFIFFITGL